MTKTEKQRRDVLRIERRRPFPLLPRLALTLCSTYGSKPWVSISAFPMVSHCAEFRRRGIQSNPGVQHRGSPGRMYYKRSAAYAGPVERLVRRHLADRWDAER